MMLQGVSPLWGSCRGVSEGRTGGELLPVEASADHGFESGSPQADTGVTVHSQEAGR